MDSSRESLVLSLATVLVASAALPAQNMFSYHPGGAAGSFAFEHPLRSPAFTGAGPGVPVGALAAPARLATLRPLGSIAVDDLTGVVYTTNGLGSIQRSWYARLGVSPPTTALASLPIPAAVGQVYGMAVDPATKHLLLTNGLTIFDVDPFAGMAVVCAWVPAPITTLTDLEYDPAQPTKVFGVDSTGVIATFDRCAGFAAMVPPSYPVPAGAVAVGLALDRSDAAGAPPHWYVLWDNGEVWDQQLGALHTAGLVGHCGLTYIASPVNLPGAGLCGGVPPQVRVRTLSVEDNPGFGIEVGDLPAGTVLAALLLKTPSFGPTIPLGASGTFWIPGAGATFLVAPTTATTGRFALPIPAGYAGFAMYGQWAVPCAAAAAGFVLTDAIQIEVSR